MVSMRGEGWWPSSAGALYGFAFNAKQLRHRSLRLTHAGKREGGGQRERSGIGGFFFRRLTSIPPPPQCMNPGAALWMRGRTTAPKSTDREKVGSGNGRWKRKMAPKSGRVAIRWFDALRDGRDGCGRELSGVWSAGFSFSGGSEQVEA